MSALDALPSLAEMEENTREIEIHERDFPEWLIEELHAYWAQWQINGPLSEEQQAARVAHEETIKARYYIEDGVDP